MANGTIAASQLEMLSQSGTGIITIVPPNTNTNRTLTLPDSTTTVVGTDATQTLTNKTLTSPSLTTPNIDSAQFATVTGTAPIYPCRAWVNFNGTGTVAIRASGNVSSITDNSTGEYTVNFSTAMPDVNYAAPSSTGQAGTTAATQQQPSSHTFTTTSVKISSTQGSTRSFSDSSEVSVAIFR
jgi:hypothetical protein